MTLHEKAQRSFKDVDFSLITTEMLNEKNEDEDSVWHIAAEKNGLKHIPAELFTIESMNIKNRHDETVWHVAAEYDTLKAIPKHLLTIEALNLENNDADTVLHISVFNNNFNSIPQHLLTKKAFFKKNLLGIEPFTYIANGINAIRDLPTHIIGDDLLAMKNLDGDSLFNDTDKAYIKNVVEARLTQLDTFIENNEHLSNDIIHRDPRLSLLHVKDEHVFFSFAGIEDLLILNKEGVFVNKQNYKTLANAVAFIENTYLSVEKSIFLPVSNSHIVEPFTL